ncbi:MAG: SDR family NAD(P)-dependent oxidoreductase [Thermoguttaceae bacterium]
MERSGKNRVAVVTGAGKRRVGNVVAAMLAERGYAIAVHCHRSAAEAEQTAGRLREGGGRAEVFQADVADEEEVERLFEQVLDRFGRIDVLVTASAVWEPQRLEAITAHDVCRQFEINALGTFLCCRRAGLIMAAQPEGGAIVTLGDWAVARPYPNYAAYFASKGAIPAMTRSLAVELALRNPAVRVNCILSGPVMLPPDLAPEERARAVAGTLVKREGRPEHVGQAVLFLVENDFVTGVCLPVDGGRSIAG